MSSFSVLTSSFKKMVGLGANLFRLFAEVVLANKPASDDLLLQVTYALHTP